MMKTLHVIFTLSVYLFASCFEANANVVSDEDVKKKVIIITQNEIQYERVGPCGVEVFFIPMSSELEIVSYGEGNVVVYLFNSRNQMCGYTEFDSSVIPYDRLQVPQQGGIYYVVIITEKSYSEGSFTK